MKGYEIILEDKGQDFTRFVTDHNGVVIETLPYQTEFWKGAEIPVTVQKTGDLCMIHKPPHIKFGYLNYKVIAINPKQ